MLIHLCCTLLTFNRWKRGSRLELGWSSSKNGWKSCFLALGWDVSMWVFGDSPKILALKVGGDRWLGSPVRGTIYKYDFPFCEFHAVDCVVSFDTKKTYIIMMKSSLSFSVAYAFGVVTKKPLPNLTSWSSPPPCFILRVLGFEL